MMNKIKKDQVFSECLQPIFMSILDSLIYNNEYSTIDSERSDCNVGARKNRNIRDNIFVVNAIFNTIKKSNEKCFDSTRSFNKGIIKSF